MAGAMREVAAEKRDDGRPAFHVLPPCQPACPSPCAPSPIQALSAPGRTAYDPTLAGAAGPIPDVGRIARPLPSRLSIRIAR